MPWIIARASVAQSITGVAGGKAASGADVGTAEWPLDRDQRMPAATCYKASIAGDPIVSLPVAERQDG
jgi:hypothetical protein